MIATHTVKKKQRNLVGPENANSVGFIVGSLRPKLVHTRIEIILAPLPSLRLPILQPLSTLTAAIMAVGK